MIRAGRLIRVSRRRGRGGQQGVAVTSFRGTGAVRGRACAVSFARVRRAWRGASKVEGVARGVRGGDVEGGRGGVESGVVRGEYAGAAAG
jgi:hypothetical protein